MKIRKIHAVVDTKENDKCDLNRNIRQSHAIKMTKEHKRDLSMKNKQMFARLYKIVCREHPLKLQPGAKGPATLNLGARRHELKRIMKTNHQILKNIK